MNEVKAAQQIISDDLDVLLCEVERGYLVQHLLDVIGYVLHHQEDSLAAA